MRVWLAPQTPGRQFWYATSGARQGRTKNSSSARINEGAPSEGSLEAYSDGLPWLGAICRYRVRLPDGGLQSLLVGQRL